MGGKEPGDADLYQILGVPRSASQREIYAAYLLLARKWHPDIAAGDSRASEKFKRINLAYEVLSDARRRRDYDHRHAAATQPTSKPPVNAGRGPAPGVGCQAGRGKSSPELPAGRLDVRVTLPIAPEEAAYGGPCGFRLSIRQDCPECAAEAGRLATVCPKCHATGQVLETCWLEIVLPRGTKSGTEFRIKGYGLRRRFATGDLLVSVRIQPTW